MSDPSLRIECVHDARLCYAMQQCASPLVALLRICNDGAVPSPALTVRVVLEPGLAVPWTARVAPIAAGGAVALDDIGLQLRPEALANATERQLGNLRVEVAVDDRVQAATDHPVEVLAYNEWPGVGSQPALLAAFVLPNHPALAPLLRDAAGRLASTTGSAALDGYRSRDPRRALLTAQAIYEAIGACGIAYVHPPASFEVCGQKVRTPEQVVHDRLGTCLDLAVLYAACLEQAGLHALLVVTAGHALAGVWLEDEVASEVAPADPLPLRKRVELQRIALVECTALCSTQAQPFGRACQLGAAAVAPAAEFLFAVDVAMARRSGLRPLPMRTTAFAPTEAESTPLLAGAAAPMLVAATAPSSFAPPAPAPVPAAAARADEDRLGRWQRRLLDLSLRNRLLNFTATKRSVALQAGDLEVLLTALGGGASFTVLPAVAVGGDAQATPVERAAALTAFVQKDLQSRRLHSELGADELDRRLLEIYRQARTADEESGVNTLFLAVGFLRWFETPMAEAPRRAPLLLVPLRIERVSLAEGFVIALADEEARINETLVQKLHHDFGIDVEVEDADDGDGPGLAAVLDAFRRAVVDVERWEVEPTACIGCFSFAKYLMWVDLAERRAELLQHTFLRHLVETPERSFAQDDGEWPEPDVLDDLDPARLLCPMDADSSQLCAVLAAAGGRSFVLEGPPGTGKSQTITNLIAQCLADGQRVLFVAEKRAALEVVQKRLQAVGLAPFCLELHSGKGQKRDVVQQLGRALDLAQQNEPQQWAAVAQELRQLRAQLNAHVDVVHRRREPGFSVFEATAGVIAARDVVQVDGLPVAIDAARLQQCRDALAAVAASAAVLGELRAHPWFGVRRPDWQPSLAKELAPHLVRAAASVEPLRAAHAAVVTLLRLPANAAATGRLQLRLVAELCGELARGPLPTGLLLAADFAAVGAAARGWLEVGAAAATAWQALRARWSLDLFDCDLAGLLSKLLHYQHRFVLLRWWRLRPVRARLATVAIGPLPTGQALQRELATAIDVAALRQQLDTMAGAATAAFGAAWRGSDSDFAQLRAQIERAERAHDRCVALAGDDPAALRQLLQRCVEVAGDATAGPALANAVARHGAFAAALAELAAPLQLCFDRAFGDEDDAGVLDRVLVRIGGWERDGAALREQCAFQRDAAAARALGLEPLELALEDRAFPAELLPRVFERSFAETWLGMVLATEPSLQSFRGVDHERRIARFRALDAQSIALAGRTVQARLGAALPALRSTNAESSELGVLLRELKKQRRHLSPRQLFARIPTLLPRLAPCLLMSPMTVAQVLGRRVEPFDVVVFDEASQVPVWDAVGAIGRGRSLVVVGDSRQLPPTQFFQRLDGDDEVDVDADRVEELESVLDECGAAGLQRLHLRWHYRSRHESLIAFSNHHYYENRLLTFPSPDRGDELGVRFCPVAGVYDRARSQTNQIEAEALVAELVRRLRATAGKVRYSHGVVTFSQAQQVLVEDLLERERQLHPELEPHFAAAEEPVFVKNLENVQGDERDVMLFSICYGPDAAGKVHMNFGPLNLQGGERRLNVAVTRARRELLVFSSVRADQIELQRTNSLGVRHLRAFLDYAARGARALVDAIAVDPSAACESPFERAVKAALEQRGCEVHAQIGCSGYRIDLAVVDRRRPGRYALGIECDGASYHASATARDRDRLRQAVLERLGWRLFRIWSTDWWLDPDGELRRFDAALAAALQAPLPNDAPAGPPARQPESPQPESQPPESQPPGLQPPGLQPPGLQPPEPQSPATQSPATQPTALVAAADGLAAPVWPLYAAASLAPSGTSEAFHAQRHTAVVRQQVAAVLATEAPIKFELLARRVAAAWSIGRTTQRVRERVRRALPADAVEREGLLWAAGQEPGEWRRFRGSLAGAAARDADLLPAIEIEAAMAWVLQQHGSLGEDDLLRETARLFGFARLGTAVRAAMTTGLAGLLERQQAARAAALIVPTDGPKGP